MVTVTPKAVEKIREAFKRENVSGGLRLGVRGGGCSGLSYLFKFDPKPRPTDSVLESDDLKKRFYDRSRQWHPDRFSRASSEEKQRSEEMTAVLNDAFRTLRDPVARAEYFL